MSLMDRIDEGLVRGSVAIARRSSRASLGTYRVQTGPSEDSEEESDFDSRLPGPNPTTNTIFSLDTTKLCFVVLFDSFDTKDACLISLCSIADDANKHLRIYLHVSHHPDDRDNEGMQELRNARGTHTMVLTDECSPCETDIGRAATTGWALRELFELMQVTKGLQMVLCCGEDVEHKAAQDLHDYVNERHSCFLVYGTAELQKMSGFVTSLVKSKKRSQRARNAQIKALRGTTSIN